MRAVYKYFVPEKIDYFDYLKTKSFIFITFFGFGLLLVLLAKEFMQWNVNSFSTFLSLIPMLFLFVLQLIVLKKKGINFAGNLFSIGIILAISLALNTLKQDVSVMLKYYHGFYSVLGLLAAGIMFSNRIVVIINAIIVVSTTTHVYLVSLERMPENEKMFTSAFINHTIAVFIITLLGYFLLKFVNNAVRKSNEESNRNVLQNKKLSKLLAGIKETFSTLKRLSDDVSVSAENLRTSASQQASNVEEISATIEEMTASITQNADNTEKAAKTVTSTLNFASMSEESIRETLSAVREIQNKIMLIDDIAWQTGLLSLNASIEATKAGDAGRGFSVVAREVKKLAEKSGTGADEITRFVDSSIKISDRAGSYMRTLVEDIHEIDVALTEILRASFEQRNGNAAINESVAQINVIAQDNAHIAENLALSIAELSGASSKIENLLKES